MKLQGKVAIVTGGGTGIGKGIARCFVQEGAIVILAQRRLEQAERTAKELSVTGGVLRAVACDVSLREQVKQLVEETVREFGKIDILVNNAAVTGMSALTPFLECREEVWDHILDVNLKGAFLCSQEAARHMALRRQGVILNISSVGAFAAQQLAFAYCASKAGLEGLTKSMALELAGYGIRVNGIAPGDIVVEKNLEIHDQLQHAGVDPGYQRKTPLARRGLPDEIGRAAVFLVSEDSSFVHGATLTVDGGFLIY